MAVVDASCAVAAALFMVGNFIGAIAWSKVFNSSFAFIHSGRTQLDPEYIQQEWEFRNENKWLEMLVTLFSVFAWIAFCVPVLKVALIQSEQGSREITIHVAIAALVIFGSLTETISRLLYLGMTEAGETISKSFNLHNWSGDSSNTDDLIGWRVLQMIHVVTFGMLRWTNAVEWLFLSGIAGLMFVSIKNTKNCLFSRHWARFGLFLSMLCIVDFVFELARVYTWHTVSVVGLIVTGLNRFLFLPIWLLWLGVQLPVATANMGGINGDLDLTESIDAA